MKHIKVIHIAETDSTNRWLRSYCAGQSGLKEGGPSCSAETEPGEDSTPDSALLLAVVADYQTAGKGCGTNSWESERGKNLTFSVLLRPRAIRANRQFLISRMVSVALCETLETYVNTRVEIKWPNDIYVADRKLCGILIENRLHGDRIRESIVGIGLNVNQTAFLSDAPNPVSIRQLTGRETDREALLADFLARLGAMLDGPSACPDYEQRLYRRTGMHPYRDAAGPFRAAVRSVLDDGRLVLLDEDGRERIYAFKEVQFVV